MESLIKPKIFIGGKMLAEFLRWLIDMTSIIPIGQGLEL